MKKANLISMVLLMSGVVSCNDDILSPSSQLIMDSRSFENTSEDEALFLIQSSKHKMLYDLIRMSGEEFKLDLTERDRIYLDIDEHTCNNAMQIIETLNKNNQ